jgi:hypothetical protein
MVDAGRGVAFCSQATVSVKARVSDRQLQCRGQNAV